MTRARQSRLGRRPMSYMLAPHTVDRLTMLSDASGLSRGRIIDAAVESLVACPTCGGRGHDKSGLRCAVCRGLRFRAT